MKKRLGKKTGQAFIALLVIAAFIGLAGCGKENNSEKNEKKVSENAIHISDAEVKSGEEVRVVIRAEKEIPLSAFAIHVEYDTSMLEFKECGQTSELMEAWHGTDQTNNTVYEDGSSRTIMVGINTNKAQEFYAGDLYYITYVAKGKAGSTVKLDLGVDSLSDLDGKDHLEDYEVIGGTITIK